MHGILRNYNPQRGYGFIQLLRGRPDEPWVFFHASAFRGGADGVPAGSRVELDLVEGENGRMMAARVRLVKPMETSPEVKPFVPRADLRAQRARSEADGAGGMVA
jgi:cold shock CspA family protein